MTIYYRVEASRYNLNDSHTVVWALTDPWRREIGTSIFTYEVDYTLQETDSEWWGTSLDVANIHLEAANAKGHYGVTTRPLRDGKPYNSSTEKLFTTEEARQAYIAKHIKDAYKRAQKVAEKPKVKSVA